MIFQFLLSLFLLFDIGHCKLNLTQVSQMKTEHETFGILCRDPETGGQVQWKGPKNNVLGSKTRPHVITTTSGLSLIFKNVRTEDAGTYICRSLSTNEFEKFELTVTHRGDSQAPSYPQPESTIETNHTNGEEIVVFEDTPQEVVGKERSSLVLKCEARGADSLTVFVNGEFRNDTKFVHLGDGLLINNLTIEDSQNVYVCQATNKQSGSVAERRINVTVKHPPRYATTNYSEAIYGYQGDPSRYTTTNYSKAIYGYQGGPVNLTCRVIAEPAPSFKWYKNGDKAPIVGKFVDNSSPLESVLMLVMEDENDFGRYKCQARNSEGTLNIIYDVFTGTRPAPPTLFEIFKSNSTAIFLKVEQAPNSDPNNSTEMAPNGIQVEYRDEDDEFWSVQQFPLAEDDEYILSELSANTSYIIRVASTNLAGISEFSESKGYGTESSAFKIASNLIFLSIALSIILINHQILGSNLSLML